jgi:hypothetical protein
MWFKNAGVIRKISVRNADSVRNDPEVRMFIEDAQKKPGRKGRLVLRLSGIPRENSILAEGRSRKLCGQCIEDLEKLLVRKGCMDHEHLWDA